MSLRENSAGINANGKNVKAGQFAVKQAKTSAAVLPPIPEPYSDEMCKYLASVGFEGDYAETVQGHYGAQELACIVKRAHPTAVAFNVEKETYFFDDDDEGGDDVEFMMGRVTLADGNEVSFDGDFDATFDAMHGVDWSEPGMYQCAGVPVGRDRIAHINIEDALILPDYVKDPAHANPPRVPTEIAEPGIGNAHTFGAVQMLRKSENAELWRGLNPKWDEDLALREAELKAAGVSI